MKKVEQKGDIRVVLYKGSVEGNVPSLNFPAVAHAVASAPPTLPAYETVGGAQWAVFCPDCRRWHFHGAGAGHRISHCVVRGGLISKFGYVLEYAGKLTPAIKRGGAP